MNELNLENAIAYAKQNFGENVEIVNAEFDPEFSESQGGFKINFRNSYSYEYEGKQPYIYEGYVWLEENKLYGEW